MKMLPVYFPFMLIQAAPFEFFWPAKIVKVVIIITELNFATDILSKLSNPFSVVTKFTLSFNNDLRWRKYDIFDK